MQADTRSISLKNQTISPRLPDTFPTGDEMMYDKDACLFI